VVTARAADRRQESLLDTERKRFQDDRTAAESRLKTELAHDRDMRELSELREVLDTSARLLTKLMEVVNARDWDGAAALGDEASNVGVRLDLRFGEDHPVHSGYKKAIRQIQAIVVAIQADDDPTPDQKKLNQYRDDWLEAARAVVGSRLDD
jgi:DNA gyrase/topoisomerase IV subunit A